MKLELKRHFLSPEYTIGIMLIDGVYFCDTLEDTVREYKIKHETAIPAGTYRVILTMSQRFKKIMPLLLDVPGFDGIRIHSGNTKADTSGCILVGKNTKPGMVLESRDTFNKLMVILSKQKEITITVSNEN